MGSPARQPRALMAEFSGELSPRSFKRCADMVTAELGIKMPVSKLSMVQTRLARLARELELDSVEEYVEHLFDNLHTDERTQFLNSMTTNKTDFFREPEHFDYLRRTILPSLSHADVWSAACSSGPEPYTIAMVLSEHALENRSFSFRILATDISTKVLETARAGIYDEAMIDPIPQELRRKYLLRGRDTSRHRVRIAPALRQAISFHQLNLMDTQYGVRDSFDVIFLRNVLIYFEPEVQQAVVGRLCQNLKPGGHLITGLSEPLGTLDVPLVQVGSSIFRDPHFRGPK